MGTMEDQEGGWLSWFGFGLIIKSSICWSYHLKVAFKCVVVQAG